MISSSSMTAPIQSQPQYACNVMSSGLDSIWAMGRKCYKYAVNNALPIIDGPCRNNRNLFGVLGGLSFTVAACTWISFTSTSWCVAGATLCLFYNRIFHDCPINLASDDRQQVHGSKTGTGQKCDDKVQSNKISSKKVEFLLDMYCDLLEDFLRLDSLAEEFAALNACELYKQTKMDELNESRNKKDTKQRKSCSSFMTTNASSIDHKKTQYTDDELNHLRNLYSQMSDEFFEFFCTTIRIKHRNLIELLQKNYTVAEIESHLKDYKRNHHPKQLTEKLTGIQKIQCTKNDRVEFAEFLTALLNSTEDGSDVMNNQLIKDTLMKHLTRGWHIEGEDLKNELRNMFVKNTQIVNVLLRNRHG